MGVGDGIRHRAGGDAAIGVDVPFFKRDQVQLFGTLEGYALWFPNTQGPNVYAGGGVGVGSLVLQMAKRLSKMTREGLAGILESP